MLFTITTFGLTCGVVAALQSAADDDLILSNTELISPAQPASGEPRLLNGADGKLYLSWIEREDELASLRFSRFDDERSTWEPARTIASGSDWFVNWADTPALCVLADGTMAAHWLRRTDAATYAYEILVSLSTDGGASWKPSFRLHDNDRRAEHGFVSWTALPNRFGAIWLDGPSLDEEGGRMALVYREVERDGSLRPEVRLDDDTCTCCSTSLLLAESGELWAVYRDRTAAEIRDISFVRRTNSGWSEPSSVFDDGWTMPGCPVNGPVLAQSGESLAAAWYTGAGSTGSQVKLARWTGDRFGFPSRVDDGTPEGRPQLQILANGDAVVAWLEVDGTTAEWRIRRFSSSNSSADRKPEPGSATIVRVPLSRSSGFAQLAARKNGLVFAWTDPTESPRVRVAVLKLRD